MRKGEIWFQDKNVGNKESMLAVVLYVNVSIIATSEDIIKPDLIRSERRRYMSKANI